MLSSRSFFGCFAGLLVFVLLGVPARAAAEAHVRVAFGAETRELRAADLAKLPAAEVEVDDHGVSHRYRGVPVREILRLVGAPLERPLRGGGLALVVKVRATDGYVVVFALAEFDPSYRARSILLVDTQDGAPLPEKLGPLRLICPGDQRGARAIHQVISLEVFSVAPEGRVKP